MKKQDSDRREEEHNHQTNGLITEMRQQILIETDHCFLLELPNKFQMGNKQSTSYHIHNVMDLCNDRPSP